MPFRDFVRLVKRLWYVVVGLPIVMLGACLALQAIGVIGADAYSATSRILVNSEQYVVYGIVADEMMSFQGVYDDVNLKAELRESKSTIEITATGSDPDLCVSVPEEIAESALLVAGDFLAEENGEEPTSFEGQIVTDESASVVSRGKMYVLAFALTGLLVALCVVLGFGLARKYVLSARDISDSTDYPILGTFAGKVDGDRLLANIRLAAGEKSVRSICVMPLSADGLAREVVQALEKADADGASCPDGAKIEALASPVTQPSVLIDAQEFDFAVLAVAQWSDRLPALDEALGELELARMENVGVVLKEKPAGKSEG